MVQYTEDELLDALVECKNKHGEITTQKMNRDDSLPSGTLYNYRFSSIVEAAERAGLSNEAEKLRQNKKEKEGYTDNEIKSFISDISSNGTVTCNIIKSSDGPSCSTVRDHLQTDTLIGEQINGVKIISSRKRDYISKEEIIQVAQDIVNKNGRLVRRELYSKVSRGNIQEYFDSIHDIELELGLNVSIEEAETEKYAKTAKGKLKEIFDGDYVYVLKNDKNEFYVGKTENIVNRVCGHEKRERFDTVERLLQIPEEKSEREFEKEISTKIAREYNTVDVYGGK